MTAASHVTRASGAGNVCALTFDDGPNGVTTGALLDVLRDHRIRAVFCVIGRQVMAPGGAEVLRRIVGEGHLIGNHTTRHDDLGDWPAERVRADLVENLRIIRDAAPDAPVPYYRAPNGSWGISAEVAESLGMRPLGVLNTIDDWATQDVPTLTENLREAMRPGELVLAHDGGGDHRNGTLAAVTTVVEERLAQGWAFTLPAG